MPQSSSEVSDVVRRVPVTGAAWESNAAHEWLVTNGLGGYASGTIGGQPTRRQHAWLVAALPSPIGRLSMLTGFDECVGAPDKPQWLTRLGYATPHLLSAFRLEAGLPVWVYELQEATIERRLFMPYQQNTVLALYTVLRADTRVRLRLYPQLQPRPHEAPVDEPAHVAPVQVGHQGHLEVRLGPSVPALRLAITGRVAAFHAEPKTHPDVHYAIEAQRGYPPEGSVWTPGYYEIDLDVGEHATLLASTETIVDIEALSADDLLSAELERRTRLLVAAGVPLSPLEAELVLAADQFIVQPTARRADEARVRAFGEHARSVIAGYHWFTDWGRDTMISLEGLMLSTGRPAEARATLLTFAHHLRDGLLPNLFPEGSQEGLYHTVDATLWFFHAIDRYVTLTGDADTLRLLLPHLDDVIGHHLRGTRFGIRADADGLITQGDASLPLTWMDAKVDDWIVTPRRGKPVEINALWFNALMLLAGWHRDAGRGTTELDETAARVRSSFNQRFWFEPGGHLYDVVDGEHGDDASCRPNQVLALSLRYPVLDEYRWAPVMDVVTRRLLTPYGLRTLDPADPLFKAQYFGDLRARDAAYHQGTVWPWLIGPFIDAWLRVHPGGEPGAANLLRGFTTHLSDGCIGTIAEIFDGTEPFTPRGCAAQAWSVAEVLRCLRRLDVAGHAPSAADHSAETAGSSYVKR